MEAWVVRFTLQEAEPILHLVLCGDIDVASTFRACHLGLNFFPSFSSFSGFCGVQQLTLCFTQLVTISFPVVVGAAMKTVALAILVRRHGTIIIFLNAYYRLVLGRLGHSRNLLFFHFLRADKIHARLILLRPTDVVRTSSGWFETVRHTQYGIICLWENIDSRQVTILNIVF